MGGVKYDGAGDDNNAMKLRWDLVPYDALEKIVDIYTYGALKYSSRVQGFDKIIQYLCVEANSWIKDSVRIIQIERHDVKDFVDLVTRNNLDRRTQSSPKDSVKISATGLSEIQISIPLFSKDAEKTQQSEKGTGTSNEQELYENEDFQEKQLKLCWNIRMIPALSVEEVLANALVILTMTTLQEGQEDTYVVVATTESECLENLLKVLKERLHICKDLRLTSSQTIELWVDGDNNWQGVEPDRYFAALMRHLVESRKGERYDQESKKLHLAHAAWNCIALLWHELNQQSQATDSGSEDDRAGINRREGDGDD